jgi:selenocysteine lyase/cysteine desulfurase
MATSDAALETPPEQLARWRADTPGCIERNHLNNAGSSLTTSAVLEAVQSHLRLEAVRGGYEAEELAADGIRDAYRAVGALVGCGPENVAIVENATVATAQAMSAIELGKGDRVVTTNADYISNQLMLLSLEQRARIELVRAADLPEGGVDPGSVRVLLRDGRCRLVVISWIPTNSGLIQPVAEVARICAEAGVPCLVDATQAVGQLPIDVRTVPCTFLAATARKFLRGPRGIGFLYVAPEALAQGLLPLFPDMRGARWTAPDRFEPAPDARRFENWEFAWALVLGFGAAARYAAEAGIERTSRRARALAARVRERAARIERVRVLDRGANLGAIATLAFEGTTAVEVVRRLRERGINTGVSMREYAIIDMDAKRADQALRVSPHYYNTEAEIEELAGAVEEILIACPA